MYPQRSDAEVQRKVVDVLTKDFLDCCEGGISLLEFFGGIYFTAGGVMFVVGSEDVVDLMEEVVLCSNLLLG